MFASDDYVPQYAEHVLWRGYCTFGDRGFAAAGPGLWELSSIAREIVRLVV